MAAQHTETISNRTVCSPRPPQYYGEDGVADPAKTGMRQQARWRTGAMAQCADRRSRVNRANAELGLAP